MTEIVVLRAKKAEDLAQLINKYSVRLAGLDIKILSIVPDGKELAAFLMVEMSEGRPGVTEDE